MEVAADCASVFGPWNTGIYNRQEAAHSDLIIQVAGLIRQVSPLFYNVELVVLGCPLLLHSIMI